MNLNHSSTAVAEQAHHDMVALPGQDLQRGEVQRVLRNTYALLAMTLIFSAAVASLAVTMKWPAPGLVLTLVAYFGLLFAVHKLQNSAWALPVVFALTGFMGYSLGPILSHYLAVPGGAQTISLALGSTGVTFLALSAYVLITRKDFSFMGGFLFMGMVALLSAGLILFETSQIVQGGERNYVLATVSLFVSVFNLFTSLLALFGFGGSNE